jgi:hypothetical protein
VFLCLDFRPVLGVFAIAEEWGGCFPSGGMGRIRFEGDACVFLSYLCPFLVSVAWVNLGSGASSMCSRVSGRCPGFASVAYLFRLSRPGVLIIVVVIAPCAVGLGERRQCGTQVVSVRVMTV